MSYCDGVSQDIWPMKMRHFHSYKLKAKILKQTCYRILKVKIHLS